MKKIIVKSLKLGFIVGLIFFAIAPLGLAIAFFEFLSPVLLPGKKLIHILWPLSPPGVFGQVRIPANWWLSLIMLNGLVYSIFFFTIFLTRKIIANRTSKWIAISTIVLIFLAATGMLTNIYFLCTSPDKSWILQVGA